MHPDGITDWLGKFSKENGLPHIHPHAFRHTAASTMILNSVDLVTAAAEWAMPVLPQLPTSTPTNSPSPEPKPPMSAPVSSPTVSNNNPSPTEKIGEGLQYPKKRLLSDHVGCIILSDELLMR